METKLKRNMNLILFGFWTHQITDTFKLSAEELPGSKQTGGD